MKQTTILTLLALPFFFASCKPSEKAPAAPAAEEATAPATEAPAPAPAEEAPAPAEEAPAPAEEAPAPVVEPAGDAQ